MPHLFPRSDLQARWTTTGSFIEWFRSLITVIKC